MHNNVTTSISHWKTHRGTKDVQSQYITVTKLWSLNLTRSNQQCLYFPLQRCLLIEPLGCPRWRSAAAGEDADKEDTACEDLADEDVGCEDPADEEVGCEDPADEGVGCEDPADEEVGCEDAADEEVGCEDQACEEDPAEDVACNDPNDVLLLFCSCVRNHRDLKMIDAIQRDDLCLLFDRERV